MRLQVTGKNFRRNGTSWFVLLLVASIAIPIFTFLAVGWLDRRAILKTAQSEVADVAEIAAQQFENLLQTQELVAKNVSQHIAGMSWDDIGRSARVHAYLRDLDQAYPQVQAIWLADPAGRLVNSSRLFPMPDIRIPDRDYFIALRARDTGTFFGQMVRNRVQSGLNFNVVRRRESPSGVFDGLVIVSTWQSQIAKFWRAVSPDPASTTALIRGDGMVLARQPELQTETPQLARSSLARRAAEARVAHASFRGVSPLDGVERFYVVRRIDDHDVYLVHGAALSSALAVWHRDLWTFGGFFGIATVALAATAVAALRQARRERQATERWRVAAELADNELTRRMAVEEQLLQSRKMEALGQMAGSIAHDFGNILMVIINSLERLRGRQGDPQLENRVEVASGAADRAAEAIRLLLAFARRQPLQQAVYQPNDMLKEMRLLLEHSLGRLCTLTLDLANDAWPVMMDRGQFEMAILNLAVNARDAMPGGGMLRIATANSRLDGEPAGLTGRFVTVAVTDTGSGMSPEVAARVFEPFFTTKPEGQGTGLGLSQVYGFARQSGGTATLRTAVGEGTTFTLYLPCAMAVADPDAPTNPPRPA